MLGNMKKFLHGHFVNDAHPIFRKLYLGSKHLKDSTRDALTSGKYPFLMNLYFDRKIRKLIADQERKKLMTYSEIETLISKEYALFFGRKLNWDNPQTYNEKIHVSKLYMPSPLKTKLADKVAVREWITEKIGSEYLIPLLGVYDNFDEIDFDTLPERFVIKCNHDSGSYTLVKDKSKLDKKFLRRKYEYCLKQIFALLTFEMHYRDIQPKIVIESFLDSAALNDYRFFCFDGKPYYCAIDFYDGGHTRNARNFYGMNWNVQPFVLEYPNYQGEAPCPKNFDEMKKIAEELCKGFGHVRVDLYSAGEKIYFGEMTFAHANGFQRFMPDEWDYKLGALWPFDNSVRKNILAHNLRP